MKKICGLKFYLLLPLLLLAILLFSARTAQATISQSDVSYYFPLDGDCSEYYGLSSLTEDGVGWVGTSSIAASFDNDGTSGGVTHKCYGSDAGYGPINGEWFTFSSWYKKNATPGVEGVWWASEGHDNFDMKNMGTAEGSLSNHFDFVYAAANYEWISTNVVFSDTNWHNYIVTGQWGNMNSTIHVYVDGSEITGSWGSSPGSTAPNGGGGLKIGAFAGGGGVYGVNGYVDDTAMFNRVLTSGEITTLQTHTVLGSMGPPPCVSYTYTSWGVCDGYNQVRNIATKTPSDCVGGAVPVLGQSCFVGNDQLITPTESIYYLSTSASNLLKYVYSNRISGVYPRRDYINIYKRSTSSEDFISSSTIEDLSNSMKQNGLSYFVLIGTSTDYIENVFTYYDVVPVVNGLASATTTFPVYWVEDNNYFFQKDALIINGSGSASSSDTSTAMFLGVNAYQYVCSPEAWASSNWFVQIGCQAPYKLIRFLGDIGDFMETVVSNNSFKLRNIFPFSVPVQIYNSWVSSETVQLPSDLAFLGVADDFGNVDVAFPALWSGTSTTAIHIWGPQVFADAGPLSVFFGFIRSLSTYILWIGYIWGIWSLGQDIIENEFGYTSTMSARRKEDYQTGAVDDYYHK